MHAFAHRLQEARMLIGKTNETPVDPFDIISDRRSVTALCLIYSSMVSHATQLKSPISAILSIVSNRIG